MSSLFRYCRVRRLHFGWLGALSAALAAISSVSALAERRVRGVERPNSQVSVHLFDWRWDDVARECEEFLGPNGFAAVQVSPPQEHAVVVGNPWWSRYQVVSYQIGSRSGDREAFKTMVSRCRAAGVDIYVDAILNHTTGVGSGVGYLGTPFGLFDYPGIPYGYDDFHHCGRHGDNNLRNFQDRYEVQNCQLVRLADLKTGSPAVRDRLGAYLNDLLSMGVAGFRIDAAKHMPAGDIVAILARLDRPAFIYQEVIEQPDEPIRASEYFAAGRVTEFRYGREVTAAFRDGDLRPLQALGRGQDWIPSDLALVFIDNHDNQRGHGGGGDVLTFKDGKLYELAVLFMLAHPYGQPRVMSSFDFDDTEQGPPTTAAGGTRPVYNDGADAPLNCFRNDWKCEHRWPAVANMVAFRQTVAEAPLNHWWADDRGGVAFGRGDRGFIALNRSTDTFLQQTLPTGLPAGQYCNTLRQVFDPVRNTCSGPAIVVGPEGAVTLSVEPMGAVALHVGARISETD